MSRHSMLRDFRTGLRAKLLLVPIGTLLALSFALVCSTQESAAATQGPVAEYSFDGGEAAGTTAEDLSGNKHEGTIEGATWVRGKFGDALRFVQNEGRQCVTVGDSPDLRLEEEFTLSAWIRPEEWLGSSSIISKELEPGSGQSYSLGVGFTEYGRVEGWSENEVVYSPDSVEEDVWTQVTYTYDGDHARIYLDGDLVQEKAVAPRELASTGPLEIGCDSPELGGQFFGRVDEVRIYERSLSAGEVAAEAQTPIETPASGPVAEYSFDQESETAVDLSGHKNEGTIEATEWVPNGRYGGALNFDGEESCVTVPDSGSLHPSEEFTLEAWVKPKDSPTADPIIFKAGEGTAKYAAVLGFEHYGRPLGWVDGEELRGPSSIGTDVWTHIAFTYDGDTLRLYVDGEVVDSEVVGKLNIQSEEPEGEEPLYIGCDPPAWGDHFHGRIDEPKIYERALSPGEVAADMEAPIETPRTGPIAAYSFDEGEPGDETADDVTGHGHTATLEGGTEWTRGRYGGALGFLKEGDCASVADSPELRLTEEFTIEAWVRPDGGIYEDPVVVRESGGEDIFGLGIGSTEEGYAEAFIGEGGAAQTAVGGPEIREYEWVHLAATWDGQKIRLYVDGELADTQAASAPGGAEGGLRIGCDSPNGPFGGRIDELRVYGRTLNQGEVAADMETPLETPKATPVAKYSFDEANEETTADLSGDGHTATVEGAKWTEHGRYGGAYEFDAEEEDVLKIPASEELDFDEEFTLEAWVRPSGEDNHHAPLVDKQEGSGLGYFLYEGGTVSDRPVGAIEEGQEHVHADDPLPAHAWSHVALTFTGNRTYLYVDGELIDNGAAEPVVTSEGALEIGGSTGTGDYFDGRIDEVRIYNRGLSAAEIATDMETPIQTPKQGPIAAWSFDEDPGEGTAIKDLTGDGHTATIHGATWTAHGRYGGAMAFDGEADYLSVPASPELDLTEAFTLEAWIRPEAVGEFDDIFSKENSGEPASAYVIADHHGQLAVYPSGNNKEAEYSPGEEIDSHAWTHVVVTYDGAYVRLYLDDEFVEGGAVSIPSSNGELRIGSNILLGPENNFDGRIDEVRIYNRALSADEATDIEGPRFPAPFQVSAVTVPNPLAAGPVARTTVFFPEATDPALTSGHAGTGTNTYTYRYALNEGSFGKWRDTSQPGFTIAEVAEEAKITIQAYATDRVGNQGAIQTDTVIAPAAIVVPEESAEEIFDEEAGKTGVEFGVEEHSAGESASAGALSPLAEEEPKITICGGGFDYIHESHHERKLHGRRRVNVEAEFHCNGNLGILKGEAVLILVFSPHDHPNKMIWMGQSKTR